MRDCCILHTYNSPYCTVRFCILNPYRKSTQKARHHTATMMLLRSVASRAARAPARPQRRSFIDWMTNYPDRVRFICVEYDRRTTRVGRPCTVRPLAAFALQRCTLSPHVNTRSMISLFPDCRIEKATPSGRPCCFHMAKTTTRHLHHWLWVGLCNDWVLPTHGGTLPIGHRKRKNG